MKTTKKPLASIFGSRSAFWELFLVAVVIGLGLELVGNALYAELSSRPHLVWIFGFGCILFGLVLANHLVVLRTRHIDIVKGFFIHTPDTRKVLWIDRYDYGEDLVRYLRGAFHENAALEKLWLSAKPGFDPSDVKGRRNNPAAAIILEATEYYVLSNLSTHLTDYFNGLGLDNDGIVELRRDDIPQVLLQNRFMRTFSEPMENRVSFVDDTAASGSETVYSISSNGAIYEKFDMVLPKQSKVTRSSDGTVGIETPRASFDFRIDFAGTHTNVPFAFLEHYLRCTGAPTTYDCFEISVRFDIRVKPLSLLRQSGWNYYQWIDSFLHDFTSRFSRDAFFASIHWEAAETVWHLVAKDTDSNDAESVPN